MGKRLVKPTMVRAVHVFFWMMYNVTELNHPSWHAAILVLGFITVGTMTMHQLYAFLRKHVVSSYQAHFRNNHLTRLPILVYGGDAGVIYSPKKATMECLEPSPRDTN
ncbi:hypothetical protein DPMN_144501 [Dreissena polymorpha]|uniref:Uncharacterized protein n=1 Tax=Dreissena polymorpha TaxID=45954 RepID=A0A9D4JQ89_DREPO|nr:hypothetical protein DPMN_144501 [Dreissena polymorpha]